MANDSAGLLDARRIDKAHMVCASLGGAIGQLVAANHRENAIVRLNHLLNREQRAAAANITGSELIEIPTWGTTRQPRSIPELLMRSNQWRSARASVPRRRGGSVLLRRPPAKVGQHSIGVDRDSDLGPELERFPGAVRVFMSRTRLRTLHRCRAERTPKRGFDLPRRVHFPFGGQLRAIVWPANFSTGIPDARDSLSASVSLSTLHSRSGNRPDATKACHCRDAFRQFHCHSDLFPLNRIWTEKRLMKRGFLTRT